MNRTKNCRIVTRHEGRLGKKKKGQEQNDEEERDQDFIDNTRFQEWSLLIKLNQRNRRTGNKTW